MILIDFTNNETVEFTSVSTALSYTLNMLVSGIHCIGIRSSNASDYQYLQDYIAGLYKSIKPQE